MLLLHGCMLSVGADRSQTTGQLSVAVKEGKGEADAVALLFQDKSNSICGGGNIRKWLTEIPTDSSFRIPQGSKIEATADAFLAKVKTEIMKLTKEVERLQKEVDVAVEKTAPARLDIDGEAKRVLAEILQEPFGGTEKMSGAEKAKKTSCGQAKYAVRKEVGVPRGAYKAARDAMEQHLLPIFKNGKVRFGDEKSDSENMFAMCGALLGWDPKDKQDDSSYCDELCGNFARTAMKLSGEYAGSYAGPGVKTLEDKLAKARAELVYQKNEEDECKHAKASLQAFALELDSLNKDIEAKHEARMDAQERLDDAEGELESMESEMEDQTDILTRATEEFDLATQKVNELTGLVAAEKSKEAERKQAAKKAREQLDLASTALKDAEAASVSVDEIKGLVVQTMVKMVAYHEAVIVQPVKNLGLSLATSVAEFFEGMQEEATEEKEAVDSTLKLMDGYCRNTASKAFEKIKGDVDLTRLCQEGTAQEVGTQIDVMVKQRAAEVQKALEAVQQSADLYLGQEGMSKAESDRLTSMGELAGVREVASVYAEASYYEKYLAHWKIDAISPKFLDLIASLKAAVERLTEQEANLKSALEEALRLEKEQLEARKKVVGLLKQAMGANQVAQAKQAEAQGTIDSQERLMEEQISNIDKLEEALRKAQRAYTEAKNLLTSTYKKGTNLA